eukprot:2649375-Amphidinium_carterae.1
MPCGAAAASFGTDLLGGSIVNVSSDGTQSQSQTQSSEFDCTSNCLGTPKDRKHRSEKGHEQ